MASPDPPQAPPVTAVASSVDPGRQALFRTLFEAHFTYVWNALRRLGVREADREDLANEVFFRVYRALDAWDQDRPLRPWLFAFAVRVASEHRRLARNRLEILGEHAEPAHPGIAADDAIDDAERRALVAAGLAAVDFDKRAVMILHDLDEHPIPEVATALGIPEGTAYSRLRAAREQFTAAIRRQQLGRRST